MNKCILLLLTLFFPSCESSVENNDKEEVKEDKLINIDTLDYQKPSSAVVQIQGEVYPIRVAKPIYGIGVVTVDFSFEETIVVYKSPEMEEEYLSYEPSTDILLIEGEEFRGSDLSERQLLEKFQLNPRTFYLEYHMLLFDCIKDLGDKYEVLLNPASNVKGYLYKKDSAFYRWADYIQKAYILFNPTKNPLRENPSIDSSIVYEYNDYFFEVIEVKEDWIKIKCNNDCKKCNVQNLEGWVRWRDGNEFLVQIGFLC